MNSAIELVGGMESAGMIVPELCVLRGDLLVGSGARDEGLATWREAQVLAHRLDAGMPELRALTRLVGAVDGAERATFADRLRAVRASVTEGLGTADLEEADAALA